VRDVTRAELLAQGLDSGVIDSTQLVLSELVGDSVRACGDHVPLVVEVRVTSYGVAVNVHDPDPGILPAGTSAGPRSASTYAAECRSNSHEVVTLPGLRQRRPDGNACIAVAGRGGRPSAVTPRLTGAPHGVTVGVISGAA
jgi:hypothetical protein